MYNSGVYEIVNQVNGKRYVGSAVNLDKRKREHFSHLRRGKHCNDYLQKSANKYGLDNFHFKVLVDCSPNNVIAWEQIAMDALNPEYNICPIAGSRKGAIFSKRHREKLSSIRKGMRLDPKIHKKAWKTRRAKGNGNRKIESILKTAEKNRGKKRSPESVALLTNASRKNAYKLAGLNESQIIEMRHLYESGEKIKDIAVKFSVNYEKARMVIRRNIFAWVK